MKKGTLLFLLFIGCGDTVNIDQSVELDRYMKCTYIVATYVWINGHIEYSERVYDVHKDSVEMVKKRQYAQAEIEKAKIIECLKVTCTDCEKP